MAGSQSSSGINLDKLTQQETALASSAATGGFTVEPAAVRQAAAICGDYAQRLNGLLASSGLENKPFLGSCWIANNLSEHFHNKAVGSTYTTDNVGANVDSGVISVTDPNSVTGQIAGIAALMRKLGDTFGVVADNYSHAELRIRGGISGSGQGVG